MEEGGVSTPPFLLPCSGTALICGSADCLYDDIDDADRPDVCLIGVNGAPVRAHHRFSAHPRNLHAKGWVQPGELAHGAAFHPKMPWVDHWWPAVNNVAGTSGWAAAKMAILMGFDEVILCGIPIDDSCYMNGRPAKKFEDPSVLEAYRAAIIGDTAHHSAIRSMSGWTRALLGPPS